MTTISRFNKATVDQLLTRTAELLKPLEEEFGIRVEQKFCTYRADECPIAFKAVVIQRGEDGEALDPMKVEWDANCWRWGLKPDDFGKTFSSGTHGDYTICGCKPKSRKYPVLGRNVRGTAYKFAADVVERGLQS